MGRFILMVAMMATTGCATGGAAFRAQCSTLLVENRGHEHIRLSVNGRRIGSLNADSAKIFSLCQFRKLASVQVYALGGRYGYSVERPYVAHFDSPDNYGVSVTERALTSRWTS